MKLQNATRNNYFDTNLLDYIKDCCRTSGSRYVRCLHDSAAQSRPSERGVQRVHRIPGPEDLQSHVQIFYWWKDSATTTFFI